MPDEKTLGEFLRQERDRRGESLEQVHERTGIGARVLASLEEGTGDVVEGVYLRLALTSYGEYLGLAADDLLTRFDQEFGPPRTTEVRQSASTAPTSAWHDHLADHLRRLPPLWIGGAFAVLLLAVILLIVYLRGGDTTERAAAPARSAPSAPLTSEPPAPAGRDAVASPRGRDPGPDRGGATSEQTPVAAPEPRPADVGGPAAAGMAVSADLESALAGEPAALTRRRGDLEALAAENAVILEGLAVDSTWVQVQWDGRGTSEEIIPRGERRVWAARDSVLVWAGRAHGIRFYYRGQLLGNGRLGDPTKVLRLRAMRDGVALLGPDLEPVSRVALAPDTTATETDVAGP